MSDPSSGPLSLLLTDMRFSSLRDLTSATEAESKRKITDLEKELDLTSDLQGESSV